MENCHARLLISFFLSPFQFQMSVTVSDGRNYDTTDIKIEVSNVNDQRPIFNPAYYNISVQENTECDVKKIQVRN